VPKQEYNVEEALVEWLSGAERVVVAGIGNPIRSDDFVGVKIVQGLQGKVSDSVYLIECETVPESFVQQIIDFKPTHVLLIDAALLGLEPGNSRIVEPEQLTNYPAFSTHLLPLRIFCEHVVKTTGARVGLLLIQPANTDFGEKLTPEIEVSAQNIVNILVETLP
jgi:hydrogenase 3 maturation protease